MECREAIETAMEWKKYPAALPPRHHAETQESGVSTPARRADGFQRRRLRRVFPLPRQMIF
jgi:hypothetical protein